MFGHNVIEDKELRDLWYNSQVPRGPRGHYAYGLKALRCFKTSLGYRIKTTILPSDTPIYDYGYESSDKFKCPQGAFVYKCQIPGVDLCVSTVESRLFRNGDPFLVRSRKHRLKVRCGNYYRVVLLKNKCGPFCYIFGTNIRVVSHTIPSWMRRPNIIFPNPLKTSRRVVRSSDGREFPMGRGRVGAVTVAGIPMVCTSVRQLCTVIYEGKRYYAHHSVML